MSKKYEKVGKGRFFQEQNVEGNKPAFRGSAEIAGREFEIALWPRESKGHRYLSIQFNDKGERNAAGKGSLFMRDAGGRKPIASGPMEIGDLNFQGAVWKQKSEAGNEYYSLKIELVTEEE